MTKVLVGLALVLIAIIGAVGAIRLRSGGELVGALVFWVLVGGGGLLLLRSAQSSARNPR